MWWIFVTFLNSDWSKYSFSEKNLGLKVTSWLSDIAKKYGRLKDAPKFFDSLNDGVKKPDFLSTVGSGWKTLENIR